MTGSVVGALLNSRHFLHALSDRKSEQKSDGKSEVFVWWNLSLYFPFSS